MRIEEHGKRQNTEKNHLSHPAPQLSSERYISKGYEFQNFQLFIRRFQIEIMTSLL